MMEFLDQAPPLLQGFWILALLSSFIFVIQTLASFIGHHDTDVDFETDIDIDHGGFDHPSDFFTFKNLIYFFIGFGWTGVLFFTQVSPALLLVFAFGIGIIFVYLFFFISKQLMKLGEDNSFRQAETLMKVGEVYLPIPQQRSGSGKIHISVRGALHELAAQTEGERLPTGTKIIVKDISPENELIVERYA